jgi:hypothetical protein
LTVDGLQVYDGLMAQAQEFTASDFDRAKEAYQETERFLDFVLERFKTFILAAENFDVDERVKRGGGFVSFTVDRASVFDDKSDDISIREFTDNDRGPGSARYLKMPKSALFEPTERERDMVTYLALKEKLGL